MEIAELVLNRSVEREKSQNWITEGSIFISRFYFGNALIDSYTIECSRK